ncbi:MAG: cobalamin-dependent protein [Chitinispirillaceae bacterium]|nr:cobalamin-dependent protein [Chitinispirillaceae bacterium]
MSDLKEVIENIGKCVERGKVNKNAPYPPDMRGMDGSEELTKAAIELGADANAILNTCISAMTRVGEKFSRNEIFVPEMLMAAKAMKGVTEVLKPFFKAGALQSKGKFIIGTVAGDLHDIGKNLVSMFVEGNGWEVVDLGVDVKPVKFLQKIEENPSCIVGLSALLTTTMVSMANTVKEIKAKFPEVKIIVGGAPLSMEAANDMGADGYAKDPQAAVEWLNEIYK